MRILLVEDNQKLLKSLRHILEKNHFLTDGVTNGREALEYAKTNIYDGIVMDIMLPELDGISVLKALRNNKNATPVLLLTARTEVCQRVEGLDAGADDYLTKPFSVSELLARIRAMLRRRESYLPEITSCGELILRQYRTKIVCVLRRQFFRQIATFASKCTRGRRNTVVFQGRVV